LAAYLFLHEPLGYFPDLEFHVLGLDSPEQVKKASDRAGPPRLVAGAKPRSVVAVEIFGPHFFQGIFASRASFNRFCSVTSTKGLIVGFLYGQDGQGAREENARPSIRLS